MFKIIDPSVQNEQALKESKFQSKGKYYGR